MNQFSELYRNMDSIETCLKKPATSWRLTRTDEKVSLRALKGSDQELILIAGRQIVTQEKLEVLALLTRHQFSDGLPLEKTVRQISSKGGIPVIPWGAGKWMGQRGKVLKKFLHEKHLFNFFLGDNGGRPSFWRKGAHFEVAKKMAIQTLRGSDPLPLSNEMNRIGSFGFVMDEKIDIKKPARSLKQFLNNQNLDIKNFGNLEHPIPFFKNQILIRRPNFRFRQEDR